MLPAHAVTLLRKEFGYGVPHKLYTYYNVSTKILEMISLP